MASLSVMRLLILISLLTAFSLSACRSGTSPVRPTAFPEISVSPAPVERPIIQERGQLDHLAQKDQVEETQVTRQLERYRRAETESQQAAAIEQNVGTVSPEVTRHLAALKCTAQRLGNFVGTTGIKQSWPVLDTFPKHLAHNVGEPIPAGGESKRGYKHIVYVDMVANSAYVVEFGQEDERNTVYGPLPVAQCPEPLDDEIAEDEIEEEETSSSTRGFNMEIRQRIEDRLEQRRLETELGCYDSYDIDDY